MGRVRARPDPPTAESLLAPWTHSCTAALPLSVHPSTFSESLRHLAWLPLLAALLVSGDVSRFSGCPPNLALLHPTLGIPLQPR